MSKPDLGIPERPPPRARPPNMPERLPQRGSASGKWLFLALLFLLVVGAGIGFFALPRLLDEGQAAPPVQIQAPSPGSRTSVAVAPTSTASPTIPTSAPQATLPVSQPTAASASSVTPLPTPVVESQPTNTPTPTNTAMPTRTPTTAHTLVPAATRTPKPAGKAKFTDGDRTMYLDSGVVRIGVDKDWGGAIREIWFDGQNLVNNWDGGRLIAVSIYDGNAKTGWEVNIP
ncbi:MAG: hypothetical protein HY780_14925, partial [Chloroflexi bacterium]|nr:hypothetical protein [Chloroflexota bacterium]